MCFGWRGGGRLSKKPAHPKPVQGYINYISHNCEMHFRSNSVVNIYKMEEPGTGIGVNLTGKDSQGCKSINLFLNDPSELRCKRLEFYGF